ncbi:MAM domain-containing glycosylphosphatidylinositol anchor protein 2-like, partial [Tachysurus ichikawai]
MLQKALWMFTNKTSVCCPCTGKAYAPEFYYDTYSPLWQNRPRVYGYKLQWTQMNPDTVDRIMAYRLGIRQ